MKIAAIALLLTTSLFMGAANAGVARGDPAADGATLSITLRQGTNFSVAASPDHGRLIINLQGSLWGLPAAGGTARRLTSDLLEPVMVDWSPRGDRVLFQSYADGMFHLWTMKPDGSGLTQLTSGDSDDIEPRWSPDASSIVFVSDRAGNRDLWVLDPKTFALKQLTSGKGERTGADVSAVAGSPAWISDPAWSPNGGAIAFVRNRAIELYDLATGASRVLVAPSSQDIAAPNWSPDGRTLSYEQNGQLKLLDVKTGRSRRLGDKADVFPFPAVWVSASRLMYTGDGGLWTTTLDGTSTPIPFAATVELQRPDYARKAYDFDSEAERPVKGFVGPALSPDGKQIVFKALNDLWRLPIGGRAERLTHDSSYEIDPAWSPDGTKLAYASDTAGTQDLYIRDLASGATRRVTDLPGAEVAPAWSPDGRALAFETQAGDVDVVDLGGGQVRTLVKGLNAPGRPSWSPDGRTLVLAALQDAKNRILSIDAATGAQHYYEAAPHRSISTRGEDGPVWSAAGTQLLFSMGSTLWLLPVAPDGRPLAPARQITQEASDAPTWSRDGEVLYLHNGQLRLIDLAHGGGVRTVDAGLSWRPDKPHRRSLIQAGRLWDGVHPAATDAMDILVVDNRIRAIGARGSLDGQANGVQRIDAAGLTVVPGLFDMHNHQQMRSKFLGDRQGRAWLAYGVTTTRSTGDQVYHALEDQEALASGDRIGPRYFMTGEMFEGSRLEWQFARPVENAAQLRLDLSRAHDLGFDLIKTYVRFRFDWQAQVIDDAHKNMGVSVTSHYLYPGVAHAIDGEEHLGGPTRWGLTEVSSRGHLYQDVFDTITKAHLQVTTTNFFSAAGLAQEPSLVSDPRIMALYPAWEQDDLRGKLLCAQGRGPCGFLAPSEAISKSNAQTFARLLHGGATVMAGTDSPLDSYALSLQLNLRSMAKYGMTPFETLQIATMIPARAQGVDKDLGSVEAGKLADMVFVAGDPSRDIDDLNQVRMVMKNGRLFTVEELMKPFAKP